MTQGVQNIARSPLGRIEAMLLEKAALQPTFSIQEAKIFLGPRRGRHARQILARLRKKGWIERVQRGRFAVIPLSSGTVRTPQIHEFLIAMELVRPAAIAYLSAMNHHGMTEQLPRTVLIATNHRVRRPIKESLGYSFRIISLRPARFFGLQKAWINEQPFLVTNREKTVIDGLDQPKNVGGIELVAAALTDSWEQLDEARLREYARRIGNTAVAKRLGFLMEALGLGKPEVLRSSITFGKGFSRLDPTLPTKGRFNRRWGLIVNAKVGA
jgi:predicted transcriptional regulator of viral defense system